MEDFINTPTFPVETINRKALDRLIQILREEQYQVIGPTLRDGAIVYDSISGAADLPMGWTDEQSGGWYRLKKREDESLFAYTVGPHSWKKYLFPSRLRLWRAKRNGKGFHYETNGQETARYAFLGVRACELRALAIQDKVFLEGQFADPFYRRHREALLIIAVNCTEAGGTCFCASMKTGPKAESGFDLALTELLEEGHHHFLVESGTDRGRELLKKVSSKKASAAEREAAEKKWDSAARSMGRRLDIDGLKELLYRNLENPRWDEVSSKCLTCANCTMVCPTCFCSTMEDVTNLTGEQAERWRIWDSCITSDFSYIHGGSVRASPKSRFRQWMTHKLATWVDQFGEFGCVGCGRCITWCPVGIDITEEARAIRNPCA